MTSSPWIPAAKTRPVLEVAAALELQRGRQRSFDCPVCDADRRGSKDRRLSAGVTTKPPDPGLGWRCHGCGTGGSCVDLVALVLTGAATIDRTSAPAIRAWFSSRGWCPGEEDDPATWRPSSPPPAAAPLARVPASELRVLWHAGETALTRDAAAAAWLSGRGYNPAALEVLELVRLLPPGGDDYPWWPVKWRRSWPLVALLRGPDGEPLGLHGRAIAGARRKTTSAKGVSSGGLFLMNGVALGLVRGQLDTPPAWALVTEGITDWLRACEVLAGAGVPVFGGISGSFSALGQIAWGTIEEVWVATDVGDRKRAGDQYWSKARDVLGARARRVQLPAGKDIADLVSDREDLDALIHASRGAREQLAVAFDKVTAADRDDRRKLLNSLMVHQGDLLAAAAASSIAWLRGRLEELRYLDGLTKANTDAVLAAAKEQARSGAGGASGEDPPDEDGRKLEPALRALLSGHPLPEDLVQPWCWTVDSRGVWATANGRRRVALDPFIVTGQLEDVETGEISLYAEWPRRRKSGVSWVGEVVPRETLADGRRLVKLAAFGAPVDSTNARDLVRYLSAAQAANAGRLPEGLLARTAGYQRDRAGRVLGYLTGDGLVTGRGLVQAPLDAPPVQWPAGYVRLAAAPGDAQLVAGYHRGGSWDGWLAGVEMICAYPSILLAIYAALLPPLLELVPGIPNFVLHWFAPPETGKSTTLQAGASVCGNPNDKSKRTAIQSWGSTRTGIEALARITPGLPVFLDDTKRRRSDRIVGETLYQIAGGRGDVRATITRSAQEQANWRTILLSTGEEAATEIGEQAHAGAATRVLELEGSPFGAKSDAHQDLAEAFRLQVCEHYGHALPRLVQWLLAADRRGFLRGRYRELVQHWGQYTRGGATTARARAQLAALSLAQELAEQVLELPKPTGEDPVVFAWNAACRSAAQADLPTRVLRHLVSWAAANEGRFYGRHARDPDSVESMPTGGWLGNWTRDSTTGRWKFLGVMPHVLGDFCRREGYPTDAILRGWAKRGWLATVSQGKGPPRRTRHLKVGSERRGVYALKRQAIEEISPPEPTGDPDA